MGPYVREYLQSVFSSVVQARQSIRNCVLLVNIDTDRQSWKSLFIVCIRLTMCYGILWEEWKENTQTHIPDNPLHAENLYLGSVYTLTLLLRVLLLRATGFLFPLFTAVQPSMQSFHLGETCKKSRFNDCQIACWKSFLPWGFYVCLRCDIYQLCLLCDCWCIKLSWGWLAASFALSCLWVRKFIMNCQALLNNGLSE